MNIIHYVNAYPDGVRSSTPASGRREVRSPRFLPRLAAARIDAALSVFPVVVLMGARQTGKSTLVRNLGQLGEHVYLTLDDADVFEQALEAPRALLRRAPRLILDEVQRAPDLMRAIKRVVDADRPRQPGRFVLTGSANLLLMAAVSESLAGRATHVTLRPLTRREQLGLGKAGRWQELFDLPIESWAEAFQDGDAAAEDWRSLARRGGYPTPAYELDDNAQRALWFEGYVRTYLERDLQQLAQIHRLVDFRRLMRAICHRSGGLLNQTGLARAIAIPQPTVHRYLNLLETSYQIERLRPFVANRGKRLVKSPKAYWTDTGLGRYLAGSPDPSGLDLEAIVLADLLVWRDARVPGPEILYWRTHAGREVDLIIEQRDQLIGIEVKSSTEVRMRDARGLRAFADGYGQRVRGCLILYDGNDTYWLDEGILATPWWRIV